MLLFRRSTSTFHWKVTISGIDVFQHPANQRCFGPQHCSTPPPFLTCPMSNNCSSCLTTSRQLCDPQSLTGGVINFVFVFVPPPLQTTTGKVTPPHSFEGAPTTSLFLPLRHLWNWTRMNNKVSSSGIILWPPPPPPGKGSWAYWRKRVGLVLSGPSHGRSWITSLYTHVIVFEFEELFCLFVLL